MSITHGYTHVRRPHLNIWLVAVIALLVALVTVGAWALVDRQAGTPEGLASADVATMLDGRMVAANGGDWKAFAGYYAKDAVLEERDAVPAVVTRGREEIVARVRGLHFLGLRLVSESAPIQVGPFVAQAADWVGAHGILVYELDANGKIAHQWVMGAG